VGIAKFRNIRISFRNLQISFQNHRVWSGLEYPGLNPEYLSLSRCVRVACAEKLCHISSSGPRVSPSSPPPGHFPLLFPSLSHTPIHSSPLSLTQAWRSSPFSLTIEDPPSHRSITGRRRRRAPPSPRPSLPRRRPRRRPPPSFFFIFPKALKDELDPIYTDATLLQQVAPCSFSTCRRWAPLAVLLIFCALIQAL